MKRPFTMAASMAPLAMPLNAHHPIRWHYQSGPVGYSSLHAQKPINQNEPKLNQLVVKHTGHTTRHP